MCHDIWYAYYMEEWIGDIDQKLERTRINSLLQVAMPRKIDKPST
jgi:hypothetical protein